MCNEAIQQEGGDDDSVNDQGCASLRGGALAVDTRTQAPKDAGAIYRERGACRNKKQKNWTFDVCPSCGGALRRLLTCFAR